MKISVITWDASFREKFHTIDSFCTQDYPYKDFEFIWVDFYSNTNKALQNKIEAYTNAQLINLNNAPKEQWHLGKCMNAGIKAAKGDILVFPDGDIIVHDNHLKTIDSELAKSMDLVVFFRRWDELQNTHGKKSFEIEYLEEHTRLLNATNYAGCYAMHRRSMEAINGFEESMVFAGPGANGMETYLRIRNAGLAIKWHSKKIYHPWHHATGSSDKRTEELVEISKNIKWLKPYSGIKQSWALKNREIDLTFKANDGSMEQYMETVPTINDLKKQSEKKIKSRINVFKKIFG